MRAALVLGVALATAAGCGDGGGPSACRGVGDAGVSGARLAAGSESFGYGNFDWGRNNDCGRDSITIQGGQIEPRADGFGIGLCVPAPDRVASGPVSLADRSLVELRGASAAGACVYRFSPAATPSGTVSFGGLCTEAGASFTVSFAGSVDGTQTCGDAGPAAATLTLSGTALVQAR